MRKTIGIIGYGNMGSAIAQYLKTGYRIWVFDKDKTKTRNLSGINIATDVADLTSKVDVVILAVDIEEPKETVKSYIDENGYTFPVLLDETGEVTEVHCTYDPETRGGWSEDGRKVKGTSHWVSAEHAVTAEVRLYEHLFTKENPDDPKDETDFKEYINPESLTVLTNCKVEPSLKNASPDIKYQFLRQGYFCADSVDTASKLPVFNRIVPLRDKWSKIQKKQGT